LLWRLTKPLPGLPARNPRVSTCAFSTTPPRPLYAAPALAREPGMQRNATMKNFGAGTSPSGRRPTASPGAARRCSGTLTSDRTSNISDEEVKQMTKQIKAERNAENQVEHPWYIFLPEGRVAMTRDLVTMFALMIVFALVPFEVAFVESPDIPDPTDPLWVFNRFIDVLFIFDLLVTFLVALPKGSRDEHDLAQADEEPPPPSASTERTSQVSERVSVRRASLRPPASPAPTSGGSFAGGARDGYEMRLSRIFLAYLRSWLLVDLAALAPSTFEVYFAATLSAVDVDTLVDLDLVPSNASTNAFGYTRLLKEAPQESDGYARSSSAIALTRITKLIKLMRITRAIKLLRLARVGKTLKIFSESRRTESHPSLTPFSHCAIGFPPRPRPGDDRSSRPALTKCAPSA
jgi:hypothetical protein